MIQQTDRNPRRPDAPKSDVADGPEIWGSWAGHRHYSLEIVQHPSRARMCGFGDKDRRPLAPAAVARMVVRNQDKSIVDVDEIDWSFFLVLVDLWSADGKQEMNLVLHPSSADRSNPPLAKNRRRGASINQARVSQHSTIHPSPVFSEPAPSTPLPTHTAQGAFSSPAAATTSIPRPLSQDSPISSWGYSSNRSTTYPPPSFAPVTAKPTSTSSWGGATAAPPASTASSTDAHHHHRSVDSNDAFPANPPQIPHDSPSHASRPDGHTHQSIQLPTTPPPSPPYSALPDNMGPPITNDSNEKNSNSIPDTPSTSVPLMTSYPPMKSSRSTYTRALVGPLSANATRLQDEHRKSGIFFLFQDLSVRTEGTFRLRMRLMNVGAPPAPEQGATKIHTDVSPVLAQTFTESFTVFSAKRFPGVPDTTALSIAFGNQGQKIPIRNRHGSGKRWRRQDASSAEEEDSEVE